MADQEVYEEPPRQEKVVSSVMARRMMFENKQIMGAQMPGSPPPAQENGVSKAGNRKKGEPPKMGETQKKAEPPAVPKKSQNIAGMQATILRLAQNGQVTANGGPLLRTTRHSRETIYPPPKSPEAAEPQQSQTEKKKPQVLAKPERSAKNIPTLPIRSPDTKLSPTSPGPHDTNNNKENSPASSPRYKDKDKDKTSIKDSDTESTGYGYRLQNRVEYSGQTYTLRKLPTPTNTPPKKPPAPGSLDLSQFEDDDDELYDDIGMEMNKERPLSNISMIPTMESDEEEEEDRKAVGYKGPPPPKSQPPFGEDEDEELYDGVGPDQEGEEIYEEI